MEAFTFLIKNQLMILLLMDAMVNKLFRFIANVVSCYGYHTNCCKIPLKEYNDFLAGNMLRSFSRFAALDETGVFGSACRH